MNFQQQPMALTGPHFKELHIKIPRTPEHMWTTHFLAENSFRPFPTCYNKQLILNAQF